MGLSLLVSNFYPHIQGHNRMTTTTGHEIIEMMYLATFQYLMTFEIV